MPLAAMLGAAYVAVSLARSIRSGPFRLNGLRGLAGLILEVLAVVAGVIAVSLLLGSWVFAFRHAPTLGEGFATWMKAANPAENWLGYLILAAPALILYKLAQKVRGEPT